ncbi:outer membrane lipid asymmetry maintenance protein MlaD [Desulfofustis glycolicus]|uniref:Phospholipid/cholesterol/gamma-HCH transport system substrate-binding protein n=1 Tax=Desulfofustis glycolicus DSM 9705 TaxID=1121409 RepID=A0A1M5VS91_9BACT|nr:outer membrane lipid asymmetry maintenance protein MlaD [Desulfofustis glycolicus]MCB2216747.1 outer membrane lipid asymmetry maintenance protein MlaD [Desulfobulbaceae bacterium]SHH78060.1 phospholipid/cholesterol/gamma-HCH transport system substrate-binding protein [Desulfofustis glycolicus DSM 9705]
MNTKMVEMTVGAFMVAGFLALVYLAFNLGEVGLFDRGRTYEIQAEFDNVSGVKKGATVQVAGVIVGEVSGIRLNDDQLAELTLKLDRTLKVPTDSIASVKSQGIIGDKFIQITLGGALDHFEERDVIFDTESAIDIESLISKFAFGSAQ